MARLAEEAVHEDELARGPTDRLHGALLHQDIVVEQGHMRRELRCDRATDPGLGDRRAEPALKFRQFGEPVSAAQDERPVARPAGELATRSNSTSNGSIRTVAAASRTAATTCGGRPA